MVNVLPNFGNIKSTGSGRVASPHVVGANRAVRRLHIPSLEIVVAASVVCSFWSYGFITAEYLGLYYDLFRSIITF